MLLAGNYSISSLRLVILPSDFYKLVDYITDIEKIVLYVTVGIQDLEIREKL